MPNHYAKMTQDEFNRLLADVIDEENPKASDLLMIGGIFEVLSERYNNAVLEKWDAEQADKDAEDEHNRLLAEDDEDGTT